MYTVIYNIALVATSSFRPSLYHVHLTIVSVTHVSVVLQKLKFTLSLRRFLDKHERDKRVKDSFMKAATATVQGKSVDVRVSSDVACVSLRLVFTVHDCIPDFRSLLIDFRLQF